MIINLEIPDHNKEEGLTIHWENGFAIQVGSLGETLFIRANKQGLVSLAIQLLTLAQDEVEAGAHIHYDSNNSLENGSLDLIIEKIR